MRSRLVVFSCAYAAHTVWICLGTSKVGMFVWWRCVDFFFPRRTALRRLDEVVVVIQVRAYLSFLPLCLFPSFDQPSAVGLTQIPFVSLPPCTNKQPGGFYFVCLYFFDVDEFFHPHPHSPRSKAFNSLTFPLEHHT